MLDPVILVDGQTYDRYHILDWFFKGKKTSPLTNLPLKNIQLSENKKVKKLIVKYL